MDGRFPRRLAHTWRALTRRRRVARELDEELQFHFDQMAAAEAARGGPPDEALRRTRRRFGSLTRVREACRDMSPIRSLERLLQDVRFGVRLLVRGPVFTLVAVLSLAIGIGGNTAIFSLINAVILRPLPVERPGELALAQSAYRSEVNPRFSYPLAEEAREALDGRAELCALSGIERMEVAVAGSQPDGTQVQLVSSDCFTLLRQQPQAGRLLGRADAGPDAPHDRVVISDSYWSRRFSRDPGIVGREITINGAAMAVVGVTAPGFSGATVGSRAADIWAPAVAQDALGYAGDVSVSATGATDRPWWPQREVRWLNLLLRVPDGNLPAATEALNRAAQEDYAQFATLSADAELRERLQATRIALVPGGGGVSDLRSRLTTPLVMLLLMVGAVLVVACANLASLLLARASHRSREMAIRLSMGAGRARLVRQLMTESLLVAILGGTLGLAGAQWGTTALARVANRGGPASGIDVQPDWRVLTFALVLSLATGLLFGLLPAFRATQVAPTDVLKAQARGVAGRGRGGAATSRFLIAGQIACSLVLLTAAALFARSLQRMTRVDVGFDRAHLLVARIDPRAGGYRLADLPALHRRLADRLATLPGVVSVSLSLNGPFSGSRWSSGMEVEGYSHAPDDPPRTREDIVTPDYFRTAGLPIVRGRAFRDGDLESGRNVTIVSQSWATRYFGSADPIGRRWSYDTDFGTDAFEIVGVAGDARYDDVKAASVTMAYHLAGQIPEYLSSLEIRSAGDPAALAATVQQAVREAEPRLPVYDVQTLDSRIERSVGQERLLAWATSIFGAVALALACLGLYGTVSYSVTRRTSELGVRMALGADRGSVRRLILGEALTLVGLGVAAGLPLAALAGRGLQSVLYDLPALDPPSYAVAAAALLTIAAVAAYLPARRASRLDPMLALRAD